VRVPRRQRRVRVLRFGHGTNFSRSRQEKHANPVRGMSNLALLYLYDAR